MNRINKILLLFLFCIFGVLFISWRVMHSEAMAEILSKHASRYIKKYVNSKISFNRVSLELFPPGASLYGLSFTDKINDTDLFFYSNKTSVFFNMFDAFNNKLSVQELLVEDSIIKANFNNKFNTSEHKQKINFNSLNHLLASLPISIQSVNIKNQRVISNLFKADIRRLKVGLNSKAWDSWFDITNLNSPLIETELSEIDQVKGYLVLNNYGLSFREFEGRKKFTQLSLIGKIENILDLENAIFELDVGVGGHVPSFYKYIPREAEFIPLTGSVDVNLKIQGKARDPVVNASFEFTDLISNFFDSEKLIIEAAYKDKLIILEKLELKYKEQYLKSKKQAVFYDFLTKEVLSNPISLTAHNLDLYNVLKFLREPLHPLKGNINGDLKFHLENNKKGVVQTLRNTKISKFELSTGFVKGESVVLQNDAVFVPDSKFVIDGPVAKIEARVKTSGVTDISFVAKIGNGKVFFESEESMLSLDEIVKIKGVDIHGEGKSLLSASGPYEDVNISLKGLLENSSIVGYGLGSSSVDTTISFKDNKIYINSLSGQLSDTLYFINGFYSYDKNYINLNISVPQTNFENMKTLYRPLFDKLPWVPTELSGLISLSHNLKGKIGIETLESKGSIVSENINFYSESIKEVRTKYVFRNGKLKMNEILIKKDSGNAKGSFEYDTSNSKYDYNFALNRILLNGMYYAKKFIPAMKGVLDGNINGGRRNNGFLKGKLKLTKSYVANKSVSDSFIEFDYKENNLKFKSYYLGEMLRLKGDFYLDEKRESLEKKSKIEAFSNITDLKTVMTSFLGEHVLSSNFNGALNFSLDSKFNFNKLSRIDLDGNVLNLKISNKVESLENIGAGRVLIRDGEILEWILNAPGTNGAISSKGTGNFNNTYNVNSKFILDASFLSILSEKIIKSSGLIENEVNFSNKYELGFAFITSIKDFEFGYEGMPTSFQDTTGRFVFDGKKISVNNIKSKLLTGYLNANGEIILLFPYPKININYTLNETSFQFMKKSSFILSGNGALLGDKLPYFLSGELSLMRGELRSEFDELTDGDSSSSDVRYLPKKSSSKTAKLINTGIIMKMVSPFVVKNSLVELPFEGDIRVSGSLFSPKLAGRVKVIPGVGKFLFKSNEFIVSKGELFFSDSSSTINPELDFTSSAAIEDFNVSMKITGSSKDFDIGLSSDPPLSRKDILSLVAFGYTDEQTKDLSGDARNELSSVGVGTLLFESFKVNQALRNEFGLKLNVGTQIEEGQDSLLGGTGSGEKQGQVGRVRSATKIEVQKKLNKAMNLSVSSTVGGTIGQRQSMNLNYKINNTVSVEGVYETKTNEDGEEDIVDNSIGVDLKFRWSKK